MGSGVNLNPWWAVLLFTLALLGGCLEAPGSSGDDETAQTPGGSGGADKAAPESTPCHERRPARALPAEQRVEEVGDIECPGHYAVVKAGTGARTNVSDWAEGDWWQWQSTLGQCVRERLEVTGEAIHYNTSLHEVGVERTNCDGDPVAPPLVRQYTQASLSWMFRDQMDGFIRHEYVFPLVDGKEWVAMDRSKKTIVNRSVTYVSDYAFGGEDLEVWRVRAEGDGWYEEVWFSPDAKSNLRHQRHEGGVMVSSWKLVDSSTGYGEGALPIPILGT